MSEFHVHACSVSGEHLATLAADPSWVVAEVKQRLLAVMPVACLFRKQTLALLWEGELMADQVTLADAGVGEDSTLVIVKQLQPFENIYACLRCRSEALFAAKVG
eukprot:TRINITY_DN56442_c0_g1_i4.p2 TRINITY_DN56442_c0_g1~~TRINITY_DN56442_c0_g1_i4.p2  ORF type:complete len:105 (+),score=21.42 TRINITY_DN56442_c0_g1_i4:64-378(+)